MQSACDIPLTIYGSGGQTRAFIHIENSMDCIEIAINNPKEGPVTIFNQMTETHNLNHLAHLIKDQFTNTNINYLDNPRKELRSNDLRVTNKKFLDMGLEPIKLNSEKLVEIHDYIKENKTDVRKETILPTSFW